MIDENEECVVEQPTESGSVHLSAADIVDAHSNGRVLRQGEIDRFCHHGVAAGALGSPRPLLVDEVVFQEHGYFEFARDCYEEKTEQAFTMVVAGIDAVIDIAAWQPKSNRIALWLNRAFALGEEQVWFPRFDDDALRIWRTPMKWLAAGRQGLVVVRPGPAFYALGNLSCVAAEDVEHGEQLEKILTPPKPRTRILVPSKIPSITRSEAA